VPELGDERYISITTFRRDQSPVATPVWVVADNGRLYVWTGSQTGKVKRIRRNPAVTVAPCTFRGVPTGPAVAARAEIVPAADRPHIWRLFAAKYGIQLRLSVWSGRISALLRRGKRPPAQQIYLELTLVGETASQ
jgi:PPOX class probable F420-dependent enzyme